MNGIRTPLLHYAPAIDLPDHRGFRRIDHQVLWARRRLADIRVAIGRIPPIDAALAHRKQASTPGAFLDQGALIFGEDPLHLEEYLFCRTRAETLVCKDHFTPTPRELLESHHLIGLAAGQAICSRDQHDLKRPFRRQIT